MISVGVLLSGCGVLDGAEIHESVVTLLALDRAGAQALCMAPNEPQAGVVNHLTNQPMNESRNVLTEAARIARGDVQDIAKVSPHALGGLIIPGGFGAAKNLCTFAVDGPDCRVNPDVESLIKAVHEAGKPVGALCIAPALVARVLGDAKPRVTIGNDASTARALERMGATHQECSVEDIVIDEANRIVTTPAYMLAKSISEAATGIEKLVQAVVRMCSRGK